MKPWNIDYDRRAKKDFTKLDKTAQQRVLLAIERVAQNPLPYTEGGYGKPLGNHASSKLAGCMKIKLKKSGLRVVYRLERRDEVMYVVIISVRADNIVYKEAERRLG